VVLELTRVVTALAPATTLEVPVVVVVQALPVELPMVAMERLSR
jgi:hypothetical protein